MSLLESLFNSLTGNDSNDFTPPCALCPGDCPSALRTAAITVGPEPTGPRGSCLATATGARAESAERFLRFF